MFDKIYTSGYSDKEYAAIMAALGQISLQLKAVLEKENTITMTLTELKKQVDANTAVEASAVTLIQGIVAQLAAAKDDPVAIQALADELAASAAPLAAAVVANTGTVTAPTGPAPPTP